MTRTAERSRDLFERASQLMPGGVSSPVRAFRHVGGHPLYMARGEGPHLIDEDGNRYLDFCLAWGPLILGHAHPAVVEAVLKTARDGLAFGTTHRNEVALAELILEAYAPFDRMRFVVSGTEAVATAVRLARGATGRSLILKFEGCYHGHNDALMVKAGSGLVTQGIADSQGIPAQVSAATLVVELGDLEALREVFASHGPKLAAAIVEPLPANNGLLPQSDEFLRVLRQLTTAHGSLLIFDEVISGFRYGFHGYGRRCDVQPDLVTLGKIIGGGLPVAAVVGAAPVLDQLAPLGKVYQAGTMAGNPVCLAAGLATLRELRGGHVYAHLEALGARLEAGLSALPGARVRRVGSVFWPYLTLDGPLPTRTAHVAKSAIEAYRARYARWLDAGCYLPPSAWEVGFLSAQHTAAHVEALVAAVRDSMPHA
jgi:glutamate-1-semialdehyde 2,1-aminomutase